MEYNNQLFCGYLKTLVYNENVGKIPPVSDKNVKFSKGMTFLSVLGDQPEWQKVIYDSYYFHHGYDKVEKDLNVTFPINYKTYQKLSPEQQKGISWSRYKTSTQYTSIIHSDYKTLIVANITFIVPITIMNEKLHEVNMDRLTLPNDLLNRINKGKAKLVFYQDAEGFLNKPHHIDWFTKFGYKFNLNKNNYIVESANIKFTHLVKEYEKKNGLEVNFNTIISTVFEDDPWFTNTPKWYPKDRLKHYEKFFNYLDCKLNRKYTSKMMCLNRRFSAERGVVFYNIRNEQLLKDNISHSLHNPYKSTMELLLNNFNWLTNYPSHPTTYQRHNDSINKIKNWFKSEDNFDLVNGHSHDVTDYENNWADIINEQVHIENFINVTIETHQLPTTELFLSEKTFRPIYTAQPFLILGNPGTLKTLRDKGYKTFSDYWDESYDEDVHVLERIDRLLNTMRYIARTPWDEIHSWMESLEPILTHNFNVLMDGTRYQNHFKNMFIYKNNNSNKYIKPTI